MRKNAFSLVELLAVIGIISTLAVILTGATWAAYRKSSIATSANNIRLLCAGSSAYLADNDHVFWQYRKVDPSLPPGVTWWFGYESAASLASAEGTRVIQPEIGPLGGYVPASIKPDTSFQFTGKAFKPKFKFGYIGVGYNVLLGGGWTGMSKRINVLQLENPGQIVVFATSAQVNNFQSPASPQNPMIEEFYGLDEREVTVHFRHDGYAMVGFANGSAGLLPMDESTRDPRAPEANVGRFAPQTSKKYLLPPD